MSITPEDTLPTLYELHHTPLPICIDLVDSRWGYNKHVKLQVELTLDEARRWFPWITVQGWTFIWRWTLPEHAGDAPTYYYVVYRVEPTA